MQPRSMSYFAEPLECQQCPYPGACVTRVVGQNAPRITPSVAFDCVYRGLQPEGSIRGLLDGLQNQVRRAADARYYVGAGSSISGGLSNVRGDWLEYVLAIVFWNLLIDLGYEGTVIVRLPSESQFKWQQLYEPEAQHYLEELQASLQSEGISLTMSNPDFVCVTNLPNDVSSAFRHHLRMGESAVNELGSAFQMLQGKCGAGSIPFAITVKTSIRPDRRYQIVHEANVVKALVAHLASRFWKRDLYTAFYAMVAAHVSDSDRRVLRNPATHTLVQVSWTPVPLVDEVFEIDDVNGVRAAVTELLRHHLGNPPNSITF